MKLKHLLLLLMAIVSFSTARAATDEWKDVKFNPDVRYSQWVLDSRLGDFYGNTKRMGFATFNQDLTTKSEFPTWKSGTSAKAVTMDYVAGLVAKAAVEAAILYQDYDWSKPWFKSVMSYADQNISVETGGGSLDNLNAAKMFFGLYALANGNFSSIAGDMATKAQTQLQNAQKGLKAHNDECSFPSGTTLNGKDVSDGWFHKSNYQNQMWLDGQYMGPALLAQLITNGYSPITGTIDGDWDLIAKQFTIVWEQCWDDKEKLLYHAFSSVANSTWADDAEIWTTRGTDTSNWTGLSAGGHSAAFWGRAEGWYFLALVDVLEQMPTDNKNYATLKGYLDELAAGIAARQDKETGCWYQLLAKDGTYSAQYYNGKEVTAVSNYLESSCTAIFTAAYLKGARLKLFGDKNAEYTAIAKNAYEGLVNQFMKQKEDGTVELVGCSRSAGLGTTAVGTDKFRDGSNAYYLQGYDVTPTPTPTSSPNTVTDGKYTEGKVLGAFILAATEYERLPENEKPVLLTLDLQPECKLDGKTALEVAVSGDGTVTYQWYKDNVLISGAKGAQYVPTATGTYYCLITVTPATASPAKGRATQNSDGTYTIKSQETNVTVTAETEDNTDTGTGSTKFSLSDVKQALKVSPSTSKEITSDYATVVGGQAFLYNGKNASGGESNAADMLRVSEGVVLNSSGGSYLYVKLTSALSAGDIIAIGAEGKICVASNATKPGTDTPFPYTVKEGDDLCGKNELWFWQSSTLSKFKSLTITTPSSTTYKVTTSATNGTITVKDGNGNAVADLTQVEHGTKLVFTATPSSGYEFKSWTVDGTTVTDNPYTIESLSKATSVTANFTATSSSGGGETTTGEVIHFTGRSSSNDKVVTVVGNYATNQGTVTYKGTSYTTCVKMETSTNITLKLAVESNVTFVFKEASSKFNINGTSYTTESDGTYTIKLSAGEYTITKGATMNLFAIDVQPTGPSISITTQPQSSSYTVGETNFNPLTIDASVVNGDGYTLAYQWYKNTTKTNTGGELISDATSASYTPTLRETVGTDYYYCVVTATKADATTLTVTSDVAAVAVLNKSDIAYTTACGGNSNTWTPAAVGTTIDLSKLLTSSSTGAYTITSGNEFATLSADGKTLTAKTTGGTVTLTQAADGEYASGSKELNIAIGSNVAKDGTNTYTVKKDEVYSDGLTVTREDITMTLGNDGFWAKGTEYTAGQNIPKPDSGNIPTSGTYYKFRPTKNGTLAVNVYIGKTADGKLRPLYVSENGTAIEAKAGELTVGKGETPVAPAVGYYQGEVTFNVKANTDYYVYVNGSKMRFYGFEFKSTNSNATFQYDGSDVTFTKTADNAYEATIEVGAEKKDTNLDINVSTASGATVVCDNGGTVSDDKTTVTVKAPASIESPTAYKVTVTSADGTSTTIYKITVKLKKQTIVLKYVLNDNSEDATEERKANAEWFWDKLANPSKEFTANTLVLHAYIADSKGNATDKELTSLPSGITYESDMPSVATVDKDNGTITPVGNSLGRAYIYATLENAEYEAKETRCAVYIRDGYTYNVADGSEKGNKPKLNEFRYITDTDGKTLLRMKFGGWKYNDGKYIKPSVCQGSNWTSASDNDYVTDGWGTLAGSGVTGIDGFTSGFPGANDACDESMKPSTHYNSTRYGWFKAPSDDKNNLHDPNNITETSPFTLPVRGAYMTFEPMVNGTLSVFIIQNGAWNTWNNSGTYKENGVEYTYSKGDIKKGEFRPHSFQVVNQRGLTLSQFSTKWSVDTKQSVTSKYYCVPDDDTHSSEGILSPNVADWPEFNDGRLTDGERADIVAAWKGGSRGMQNIVMLHDGSFLAIEKGIVKYTFYVTGHETYYFFSNFSKMGFCGANFTPDAGEGTQPVATLELNDQVAYPTVTATEDGEYEGNTEMTRYDVNKKEFVPLPKIKKHTFTVTKADETTIDGVNVKGAQAPQFKVITVQREFKQDQWTTLTLPFNMTQKKVEEVFGVGTELLLLNSSEMNGSSVRLHFIYHEIQNVLPGYPYLIKPTLKDADGNNYSNETTDASEIVERDGALFLTSFNVPVKHITQGAKQLTFGEGPYLLKGVEKYCTPEATDKSQYSVKLKEGDVFLSDSNGKFYVSKGTSYCKGYRAYMTTADPQVTPAKSVILTYSGVEDNPDNGTATEISIAELSSDAVMALGLKGVYNLSGQKVADTADNLPAGMYVVNGQKIVVK